MKKYRRVQINAYRRRVTVVSGEWRPGDVIVAQPDRTDEGVSLDDSDVCEPVEPDSPEGQLILVEAVRSLERRLSTETRATIWSGEYKFVPNRSIFKHFYYNLRAMFHAKDMALERNENSAAKQSVED